MARSPPPTDRETGLYDVAVQALAKIGDHRPRLQAAIWALVKANHALTLALLESWARQAIDGLLYRVGNELLTRQQQKHTLSPEEQRAVMVIAAWRRADEDDLAEVRRQEKAANDLHQQQFQRELAAWRATAAGSFTINNKPFWQASVAEARAAMRDLRGDARFIELLIRGLPNDGREIGYYRKPSEIDPLWQQAHGVKTG